MQGIKKNICQMRVFLSGIAFTSRTETLETYLKDRVKFLSVTLFSSCFLKENLSSCRLYEKGIPVREFRIPNFRIKGYKWHTQPLVLLFFIMNWFSISAVIFKLRRKFDLYIGVSHSFAFIGAVLKKMGIVDKLIYYAIDYYIPDDRINFNSTFIKAINIIDKWVVKNSDVVWHLSGRIAEGRRKFSGLGENSYKNIEVPLGYSANLLKFRSVHEIERWTIAFIGSLDLIQGLQLLIESMPLIIKDLPCVKVKIIGKGAAEEELRRLVSEYGLNDRFTFYGFIKEEEKVLEILSGCAIGVAPYVISKESHIYYADSGKPKLYAFCGLPTVITRISALAEEMDKKKAAIAINYDKNELANAIINLLKDEEKLALYKNNAREFARTYVSESIFDRAFNQTI